MGDICGDNRFEIIAKAKKNLLESTNIHTSEDEMKVLDSFLFRCWQMGWLKRYDKPREPLDIPTRSSDFIKEYILSCPEGYQFVDENGNVINAKKIVLEKKKKEYPKTYEECCKVLGLNSEITDSELLFYHSLKCGDYTTIRLPEMEKFEKFIQLYLCRNAYWKIAGEEMGLGKPWKPDWNHLSDKWVLFYTSNRVWLQVAQTRHCVFAFPTEEMRDAFKENFDADIEFCKELL